MPAPKKEEPERKFANKESLGEELAIQELELPVLQQWVRVRYLDTTEIARLQFLPDLTGVAEMIAEFSQKVAQNDKALNNEEQRDYVLGTMDYLARVAHLAVIDVDAGKERVQCADCSWTHVPSLWTLAQVSRLRQPDLEAISVVALYTGVMDHVGPFSEEEMLSVLQVPVSTGEPIPQTS